MSAKLCWMVPLWMLGGTFGCSHPNPDVRVRRLPDKRIEVKGPRAGPFKTVEALAENACELMTRQPGAAYGSLGQEYCALGYFVRDDRSYYLSYLSDIGGDLEGGRKYCKMPSVLDDPLHPSALILLRLHTHPHNRRFSKWDLSADASWDPARLFDKTTGQFMERYLLELYRETSGECRVYQYDYARRIVSALRGGQWIPIGKVINEKGAIEMFEGQDWVP